MADSGLHRVRRLRWQARAPSAADAFALQSLLRRRSEEVGAVLEQAFASIGTADEVAEVIAGVIRSRQRDVYTRPGVRQAVLDYLGALGQDVVSTTPAPAPE